jgi:CRISPR/Cas system-associated exonuclease Cas4 (RecB family)
MNMRDQLITKDLFLTALTCPTISWYETHLSTPKPLSIHDKFIIEEGLDIHKKAQQLFPNGVMMTGSNISAAQKTAKLLNDPEITTLFEATFLIHQGVTRADIIKKTPSGLHLYEIKSGLSPKEEYIDDISYTTMVCKQAGLPLASCSLLLLNKDYRYGMPFTSLFQDFDCTEEVLERSEQFWQEYDPVIKKVFSKKKLSPEYKFECKNCEYIDECFRNNPDYHIFDLPRLSHTTFCQLRDMAINNIEDIPADLELTASQEKVREAVSSKTEYIDKAGLKKEFGQLIYPLYFLDFETVTTAIPLYEDIGPHTQIPTQYSLHVYQGKGKLVHHEYLANHKKDGRRTLAQKLIGHCAGKGSVFCYTPFEKTVIRGLILLFPDLATELQGLVDRLVDLCAIIKRNYYHRDFHGSYSIKDVLPVMVPDLNYDNMEIGNGSEAVAQFAMLVMGRYDKNEEKVVRTNLKSYCKLDTLAMVRIWERLEVISKGKSLE